MEEIDFKDLSNVSDNKLFELYSQEQEKSISGNTNQMALKILLNSGYGSLSNAYFQFFDLRLADSITRSGQCAVKWMERHLNIFLNKYFNTNDEDYVITIDTDSLYLNLQHLIDKIKEKQPNLTNEDCINILDKFAHEVIEKQIEKGYEEFYKYTNSFENQMVMKRECLCSSGVFVAKKRYVLNVFDNEGVRYEKPKLKIKGLDVVRSSTPAAIKDDIKEVYKILLDKTEGELQDYIGVVKEKYKKLTLNEISIVSSISDIDKYTKDSNVLIPKGCPMHVRGAIIYNKMIKDLKLEGKYQPIKSGDKIKYVFLQMPNHAFSDVIAYLNYFPEEFELEEYIDYDRMFERSFIGSVENVTDPIKWSWKKKNSIDDLFG